MFNDLTAASTKATASDMGGGLPRLHALTSLRFVAAAMIVYCHLLPYTGDAPGWTAAFPWSQGVSFFFVLSGFILAYTYRTFETPEAVVRFWVARFARVWPVHAVTAVIVLATMAEPPAATAAGSAGVVAANLLLVQAWVPIESVGYSLNGSSWSLSNEMFFYLLFPLLVLDWRRTWLRKLALSAALLVVVVAFGNAARVLQDTASAQQAMIHAVAYIHPLARLFEFTLGMVGFILWQRLDRWRTWTPVVATVAELGAVVLTVYWLATQPVLALAEHVGGGPTGAEWARYAGSSVVFALLVAVMAVGRGAISWALAFPLLVLLGEISYSLYLFHSMLLTFVTRQFPGAFTELTPLGAALLWLILIGVAWLSWALIEVPARRWILKAWDARVAAHGGGFPLPTAPSAAVPRT